MATKSIRLSDGTDTLLPESAQSGSGYQKNADGTLIVWGKYTGSATTATAIGTLYGITITNVATFPISFVSAPALTITQSSGYGIVGTSAYTESKITSVDLLRPNSGNITPSFSWVAIGRWK